MRRSTAFNHGCANPRPGVDLVLLTGCPKVLTHAAERKRAPGETKILRGHGPLEDRPAGRDFDGRDTPCVQHQKPVAVSTPQHAGTLRQRRDDVVDDLALAPRIAVVVRDVHAVAADEADTEHKAFHVSDTRRAQRQRAMGLRRLERQSSSRPDSWAMLMR